MRLGIVLHDGEIIEVADGETLETGHGDLTPEQAWALEEPLRYVRVPYLGEIKTHGEYDWEGEATETVHGKRKIYDRAIYELILIEADE